MKRYILLLLVLAVPVFAQETDFGIELVLPPYGASKTDVFDIKITTDVSAEMCKYSNTPLLNYSEIQISANFFTPSADQKTHTLSSYDDMKDQFNMEKIIYIKCKTPLGGTNDKIPYQLRLTVDNTPPVISTLKTDPKEVLETLYVKVVAETDDYSRCKFDEKENRYSLMSNEFEYLDPDDFKKIHYRTLTNSGEPKIIDGKTYNFFVACQNAAGDDSPTSTLQFTVNLSAPNVILSTYPLGDAISEDEIEFALTTNKRAICTGSFYGKIFATNDGVYSDKTTSSTEHLFTFKNIGEGTYSVPITCTFDIGGADQSTTATLTVDRTPPSNVTIEVEEQICQGDTLKAEFSASDNIGIDFYNYTILENGQEVVSRKSSKSKVTEDIDTEQDNSYQWLVTAVDDAGNPGEQVSSQEIRVLGSNSSECLEQTKHPPIVSITTVDEAAGKKAAIACSDPDGGECISILYKAHSYDDRMCNSCSACAYKDYTGPVTFTKNGTLCYKVLDDEYTSLEGSKQITVLGFQPKCTKFAGDCCVPESDLQCDMDCPGGIDPDCKDSVFFNDTDSDGMPDEWELENLLNITDPSDALLDYDNDTLTNKEEYLAYAKWEKSTDPWSKDTDGDGFDDNVEIAKGKSPVSMLSKPEVPKTQNTTGVKKPTVTVDEEEPEKSHTLQMIMGGLGFALLAGGVLLMLGKPKTPEKPQPVKQPTVPVLNNQPMLAAPAPPTSIKEPEEKPEVIEKRIIRSRKNIKQKRRNNVFDEFDVDNLYGRPGRPKETPTPKIEKPKPIKKDSFKKLGDVIESKTFRKLNVLGSDEKEEDLDRLIAKDKSMAKDKLDRIGRR